MNSIDRNSQASRIGTILVILGALALLSNFGLFRGFGNLMGAAFFVVGGVLFLRLYRNRPDRAALVIPAFALFAIAAAIVGGALSGTLFLGVLGLGFVAVYARDKRQWWAIIPAGVLVTLGVVAGIDTLLPSGGSDSVLFLGWAATFGLLTVLPERRQAWGIYPALGLAAIAVLVMTTGGGWLLPVIMVGAGLYLLSNRRRAQSAQRNGEAGSLVVRDPVDGGALDVKTDATVRSDLATTDDGHVLRADVGDVTADADVEAATPGHPAVDSADEAERGPTDASGV